MTSSAQAQTGKAFGYQWNRTAAFDTPAMREKVRSWQIERYGQITQEPWWNGARVLDAGCGAGLSAVELFGPIIHKIEYIGVDISDAYKVAERRFTEYGLKGTFLQADFLSLPFPDRHFDVVFAEGTLHHTDSTEIALKALARKLKPGGHFMCYVYRRKGPIREFADDYIREKINGLAPSEAWDSLYGLSQLGKILGDLNIEIDVPAIPQLEIQAGRMNLQRFFYWHIFKAFHDPKMTLDELNHINFDWYAPKNSHRQSIEQMRKWCDEAGLSIEHEYLEEAGVTLVARLR